MDFSKRTLDRALGCGRAVGGGVALALTFAGASLAIAAPNPAKALYEKGATEYNLGHFPEAIANFEKAYELDPAPILLFNIAQSHRQSGNNERALFFYRRYLEQAAPDASNRADVEKRVKDIEEMLATQSEIKRKPPTQVEERERRAPTATQPTQPTAVQPPPPPPATQPSSAMLTPMPPPPNQHLPVPQPPRDETTVKAGLTPSSLDRPFRIGADAGVAFPQFHGKELEQPAQFAIRVFGGYLVTKAPFPLELGAALNFSPLPYVAGKEDKTSTLLGLWVRAAGILPLEGGFDLLAELGAGVVWWGGIEAGNPFTDGVSATGAIPMPSVRVALGARYELPMSFFVYAMPAFSYSKTTSGLSDSISSVTRIELPIGVGVSF